ncbi:MAG: ABC transporter substrate-binding protein [Nitrososphaerales archaeon]
MFLRDTRKYALVVLLLGLFAITLIPATMFRATSQSSATSCPASDTLKLGLYGGAPNTFNMLSALPVAGVVSSLLQYYQMYPPPSINGNLVYNESVIDWYSHNSNYTLWTFNVTPGLKWSDGTAVTSQDILNTYSQNFALNSSVDFVNAAAEIKQSYQLNSSAAVFVLNVSDAIFPERVGSSLFTPIVPKSFVAQGPNFDGFGTTDVAVGPFYASNYTAGSSQGVFLRNPYFNPQPKACELQMSYFETDSSIPTYIQSGAVDFGPIPPASAASLANSPNVHIIDQKGLVPEMLTYNVTVYPYNMTQFRQAMVYATNMTALQQTADAGYSVLPYNAEGGIPPVATKWYSPNQPTYNFNTSKALQLLGSIGIKKGSDGFLQYANGTDVSLTIYYDNSFSGNAVEMSTLQQEWQALGIHVTINAASLGTLISDSYQNANNINHDMIFFKSYGAIYGYAWTAGLNSYAIDIPFNAPPSWEGPVGSVAQNEFQSNLTALESTDNATLDYQYLANIQTLNAVNIPVITMGYGDAVWAYNTQHFTNWPSSLVILPNTLNSTALAELTPVGSTTSTSSSVASTLTSSSTSSAATSSASTSTSTSSALATTSTSSSTTSTSSSALSTTTLALIAVVIVVIVAAAAALMMRSRRK